MGRKKNKTQTAVKLDQPVPYVPTVAPPPSGLKDTGARTQSVTGALREPDPMTATPRPRYDLIPPKERAAVIHAIRLDNIGEVPDALAELLAGEYTSQFVDMGVEDDLYGALAIIASTIVNAFPSSVVAWQRLAVHYARGAIKYADRNWEKGLETGRTIASLERHLVQALNGETDEDHLAAALWNVIALMNIVRRINEGDLPKELDTYNLLGLR